MQIKFSFLLLAGFLLSCSQRNNQRIDITSVTTEAGKLSGFYATDSIIKIFKGVPFAAPPVKDLRWKAPQKHALWKGILECTQAPASAIQTTPEPFYCWSSEFLAPKQPISEDCLYLNIWTPAKTTSENLPVMVWIHGGALVAGSGTVPLYDGEAMARKGIVFITINYRLGLLGFLAHPELSAESPQHISGNYGILDQIAALRWIHDNINHFGGNPENITIAGQSAGAFSVNTLVASPLAKNLFQKAIAQSGGRFYKDTSRLFTLPEAEERGLELTRRLGTTIAEMRQWPADSILKLDKRFSINTDSEYFPPIWETFVQGKQNDVPLLTGWNADDGVSFEPAPDATTFKNRAIETYKAEADRFLELFPAANDSEAAQSQKTLNQLEFGGHNYLWAWWQCQTGKNPVYLYYFKHIPPGEPNYGAFHSAEFGYALHTLTHWNRPFTEIDYQIESAMSDYWANFVKTGNPNEKELPFWPKYSVKNPQSMIFGDSLSVEPVPFRKQLEFLYYLQ